MPSNELDATLERWWNSGHAWLQLCENTDAVTLGRTPEGVLLSAQLCAGNADTLQLEQYLMLGRASLAYFQGALAQAPTDGGLWILLALEKGADLRALRTGLTDLLNQRDTWRALAERGVQPAARRPHLPTHSLS